LLNQGLPLIRAPFELRGFFLVDAGSPADEDGAAFVALPDLNKAEDEDIGVSADKTLDGQIAEVSVGVGGNFVVLAFDEVENDVGCESILALLIAEPLAAGFISAAHHTTFVSDGAVGTGVRLRLLLR
jgi:hypothetical protein